MTRETKIGLLVGLAFIIVIGILLSDHLTSSTEPPPAQLAGAGSGVRSGVTPPANSGNPPITAVVVPPQVSPQQPVLTRNELSPNGSPVKIDVGGPRNQSEPRTESPVQVADAQQSAGGSASTSSAPHNEPSAGPAVDSSVGAALRNTARQLGEELVSAGQPNTPSGAGAHKPLVTETGLTKYTAVENDTVSKLAARFLGANTRANRDAIVAANPSLKADPNRVIVGHSYMIPTSAAVPTSVGTSAPVAQAAPTPLPSTENWYTVKPNDSLWKIATEQCGGAGAVTAIQELNKDRLKGDDHTIVIEGMKLRLPGKAQVAAN